MMGYMENEREIKRKDDGPIKCPLCGYAFAKGQKTACQICPLNYGNCHFEKCPHCGYDIPQSSRIWTFIEHILNKFKKERRNHART